MWQLSLLLEDLTGENAGRVWSQISVLLHACSGTVSARIAPEVNLSEFTAEKGVGTLQKQQES